MEARRKRALLARMEGQLAAMNGDEKGSAARWQRVRWAFEALSQLPADDVEAGYLSRLGQHVMRLETDDLAVIRADLLRYRRTLVRADCVLWQLYLRRHGAASNAA